LLALLIGLGGLPNPGAAQAPLQQANSETTVQSVSFRFVDTATFSPDRL